MIEVKILNLENEITLNEEEINILQIKDKSLFRQIVYKLNRAIEYKDVQHEIICIKDDNLIEINKFLIVRDYFSIEVNSKKILKFIGEDIEEEFKLKFSEESFVINLGNLIKDIINIIEDYEFKFEYKRELDVKDFLKAMNLKFDKEYYDNPLDNILCLLELNAMFSIWEGIILVSPKMYFEDKELLEIYKMIKYQRQKVLIIEQGDDEKVIESERKIYVDEDYDEFLYIYK